MLKPILLWWSITNVPYLKIIYQKLLTPYNVTLDNSCLQMLTVTTEIQDGKSWEIMFSRTYLDTLVFGTVNNGSTCQNSTPYWLSWHHKMRVHCIVPWPSVISHHAAWLWGSHCYWCLLWDIVIQGNWPNFPGRNESIKDHILIIYLLVIKNFTIYG